MTARPEKGDASMVPNMKKVHQVMDQIEERVQKNNPNADVTVHPGPWNGSDADSTVAEKNRRPFVSEKSDNEGATKIPPA